MSDCNPNDLAKALDSTTGRDLSKVWEVHNACMNEIYFPQSGKVRSNEEAIPLVNDYMKKASEAEKKNVGADLTILDPETSNDVYTYKIKPHTSKVSDKR